VKYYVAVCCCDCGPRLSAYRPIIHTGSSSRNLLATAAHYCCPLLPDCCPRLPEGILSQNPPKSKGNTHD
jgi:hypothetical protein